MQHVYGLCVICACQTPPASLTHCSVSVLCMCTDVCAFGVTSCDLRLCYAHSHSDDGHVHTTAAHTLTQAWPTMS